MSASQKVQSADGDGSVSSSSFTTALPSEEPFVNVAQAGGHIIDRTVSTIFNEDFNVDVASHSAPSPSHDPDDGLMSSDCHSVGAHLYQASPPAAEAVPVLQDSDTYSQGTSTICLSDNDFYVSMAGASAAAAAAVAPGPFIHATDVVYTVAQSMPVNGPLAFMAQEVLAPDAVVPSHHPRSVEGIHDWCNGATPRHIRVQLEGGGHAKKRKRDKHHAGALSLSGRSPSSVSYHPTVDSHKMSNSSPTTAYYTPPAVVVGDVFATGDWVDEGTYLEAQEYVWME